MVWRIVGPHRRIRPQETVSLTAHLGDMAQAAVAHTTLLARPDSEAVGIKQRPIYHAANPHPRPVIAPPARALDRAYLRKTALPEAQHMLRALSSSDGNFADDVRNASGDFG